MGFPFSLARGCGRKSIVSSAGAENIRADTGPLSVVTPAHLLLGVGRWEECGGIDPFETTYRCLPFL
jgi:hypothetical protein